MVEKVRIRFRIKKNRERIEWKGSVEKFRLQIRIKENREKME